VRRPGQAAGRPLLPAGLRGAAAALVAACVIVTAVMGAWLAHRTLPGTVDGHVDGWLVAHADRGRRVLLAASSLGDTSRVVVICAVAVVACTLTRRYRGALLVAIAAPLAGAVTEYLLKPLLHRTISGHLAFPSGHVTGVAVMAVAAVVLLTGPARPPLPAPWRWSLAAVALLTVPAAALSVVIGHYHYFTDTIGGTAVGTAAVLATALVLDWAAARLDRRNERRRAGVATGMTSGHEITITPADVHIEVTLGGEKLADSDRAVVLAETGLPARYYLPREDVRADLLRPTSSQTTCPFKGQASYWSAEVGGEVHEDVVWSYESPIPAVAGIAGLMCFYNERVELTVDGVPQQGAAASSR
jgi:uncharacterized protein (DUF427 family)/membrane-associated phospholipid phosphatase